MEILEGFILVQFLLRLFEDHFVETAKGRVGSFHAVSQIPAELQTENQKKKKKIHQKKRLKFLVFDEKLFNSSITACVGKLLALRGPVHKPLLGRTQCALSLRGRVFFLLGVSAMFTLARLRH